MEPTEKVQNSDKLCKEFNKVYIDDMTMMMAWQNQCWRDYTNKLHAHTLQEYIKNVMFFNHFMQQQMSAQVANGQQQQQQQQQQQADGNNNRERRVVKLASIKNRILAEIVDFLLLAFIKIFVIQLLYGDSYINHFNFVMVMDENTSFTDLEWMLGQAFLFRLIVVAYEGYMLSGTLPFSKGCTIGKSLLGIKVIYADEVEDRDAIEMTVYANPNQPLGVLRSCLRSLLKNMGISFLFPMLLPVLIFNQNKLLYDCAVSSLVIDKEEPAQPMQ